MSNSKFTPDDYKTTLWINGSNRPATFDLYEQSSKRNPTGRRRFTILPGKSEAISSEYDAAIRSERNGVVTGGLCPWLKKKGEVEVKMHDSLNPARQAEKEAIRQTAEAAAASAVAGHKLSALSGEMRSAASPNASQHGPFVPDTGAASAPAQADEDLAKAQAKAQAAKERAAKAKAEKVATK